MPFVLLMMCFKCASIKMLEISCTESSKETTGWIGCLINIVNLNNRRPGAAAASTIKSR